MKAIKANRTKAVQSESLLNVADNSGAKQIKVITVKKYKGVKERIPSAGVADIVVGTVKKGDPKIRHEVVNAVIIRQRKEYKRAEGLRVSFEDNSCVLINDREEPRGTEIKGPVAKEVVQRFPAVGKISRIVV